MERSTVSGTPSRGHMQRGSALAIILALIFTAALQPSAIGSVVFDPEISRVIVEFDEMPRNVRQRFAGAGITHAALFPSLDAAAVAGPRSAYRSIAGWDEVVGVTPDAPLRLYMWQATETTGVDLVRMGVKPLKSDYTGSGVTVAVVDSGIDATHPDLAGDKVVAHLDFTPSRIFDPTKSDPSDPGTWEPIVREPTSQPVGTDDSLPHGHGTMLAGVVAGTGTAALGPDDMRGVAPGAALVDLDVGSAGFVYPSSVIAAFEWLLERKDDPVFPGGIRVAVGGLGADCQLVCEMPVLRELLMRVVDAGVVVVFASGRAADGDITYPARYPELISVRGACKDQDDWSGVCNDDRTFEALASRSIDVVAPAVAVWVANAIQGKSQGFNPVWLDAPVPGQGHPDHELNNRFWYELQFSHSAATAHIAGIAALMIDANPSLTHSDVERILQISARDLGPKGFDTSSGHGMVNALEAVKVAERWHRQL